MISSFPWNHIHQVLFVFPRPKMDLSSHQFQGELKMLFRKPSNFFESHKKSISVIGIVAEVCDEHKLCSMILQLPALHCKIKTIFFMFIFLCIHQIDQWSMVSYAFKMLWSVEWFNINLRMPLRLIMEFNSHMILNYIPPNERFSADLNKLNVKNLDCWLHYDGHFQILVTQSSCWWHLCSPFWAILRDEGNESFRIEF